MNLNILFITLSVCGIVCRANDAKFIYFAHGSNMLAKRMHLFFPNAHFICGAKLENYRLDFDMYFRAWNGSMSTVMPHQDREVWGSLWLMETEDMARLDEQEGVHLGWNHPLNIITVTTPEGRRVLCRTYQLTTMPEYQEILPMERRPSNTYLQEVTLGAVESRLPSDYIGSLFTIISNGRFANKVIREYLGYPFV